MRLLRAFVVHEARTQLRSSRYRFLVALYLLGSGVPLAYQLLVRSRSPFELGAAGYVLPIFEMQIFLTVALVAMVALDGIEREREEGSWAVLALAPLSGSGYLLGRWLAVLALVLPWTLVPPVAAAVAAAMVGAIPGDVTPFLGPWLIQVLPAAVAASAAALGVGTVTGSWMGSLLAYFGLMTVASTLLAELLGRFALSWEASGWMAFGDFDLWMYNLPAAVSGSSRTLDQQLPVSDAPYELATAAELLSRRILAFAVCLALLALAVLFLRRTAPDLRPWRIPARHSLRNYLLMLNRLRQRYWPDPHLQRQDVALALLGLLLLGLAAGQRVLRADHFRQLAAERYAAEMDGDAAVTPRAVVPRSYHLEGQLKRDGTVDLDLELALHNDGPELAPQLAFQLNTGLRATSDEEGVHLARQWDRLALALDPPLAAGEQRTLRLHLAGRPEEVKFRLRGAYEMGFATRFEGQLKADRSGRLSDLSQSSVRAQITPRRIELSGAQLVPLPRYSSWALKPEGGLDRVVPTEVISPSVGFELDLELPSGSLVASSCGDLSSGSPPRLASGCRLALDQLAVVGGPLVPVAISDSEASPDLAVLASHRRQAQLHLPSLQELRRQLDRAWPGVTHGEGLVFVERPPPFEPLGEWRQRLFTDPRFNDLTTFGQLVLLEEKELVSTEPLQVPAIVRYLAFDQLRQRRRVAERESVLFRHFFGELVNLRLAGGDANGALIPRLGARKPQAQKTLLGARYWDAAWDLRLPPLLHYLQALAGGDQLYRAVDDFLAEPGDQPGTMLELLALLEARTGRSYAPFYRDYLASNALPELSVEDVRFQRQGAGWRVHGQVRNAGTGEVRCPVVLLTDLAPAETEVVIGADEAVPFELSSAYPPQAVVLDPQRRCFRYLGGGRTRVEYRPQ